MSTRALDLSAAQVAAAAGGRVLSGDPAVRFTAAAFDSRDVTRGALFIALPGNRVDGHDYVAAAFAKGAAGVLTTRPLAESLPPGAVEIRVDDTLAAIQAVARVWRHDLAATVIGVAGSNGKTTTKETLAAVLATAGATFATPRNENSQIGAPLTILAAPPETKFLVLELGTSFPGELGRLAAMAEPDLAIITAAYAEHLEFFGDVAGVVAAETEILDRMAPGTLALVGSAEPLLLASARQRTQLRIRSLGERADDDWRLSGIRLERAGTRFALTGPDGITHQWRIPLLGAPAAWAGSFAVAVAHELGLPADAIQRGLDDVSAGAHRLIPVAHARLPLFVIDDTYNSNPASCGAAIDTALALARDGDRLILVLGDMLELGDASAAAHREVGELVAHHAPNATLIAVGAESRLLATTAREAGVAVHEAANAAAAAAVLEGLLADGQPATMLAKGSRGIGLDHVVSHVMAL